MAGIQAACQQEGGSCHVYVRFFYALPLVALFTTRSDTLSLVVLIMIGDSDM